MKVTSTPKSAVYINVLFFLSCTILLNGQKRTLVNAKIDSVLEFVDQELKNEKYTQASLIIDSLKNTKNYAANKFDKLAIDLRMVQILYESNKCEKAIYLLLDGIKNLKEH